MGITYCAGQIDLEEMDAIISKYCYETKYSKCFLYKEYTKLFTIIANANITNLYLFEEFEDMRGFDMRLSGIDMFEIAGRVAYVQVTNEWSNKIIRFQLKARELYRSNLLTRSVMTENNICFSTMRHYKHFAPYRTQLEYDISEQFLDEQTECRWIKECEFDLLLRKNISNFQIVSSYFSI